MRSFSYHHKLHLFTHPTSIAEFFPQFPRKNIFFPPPALSLHVSTSFVPIRPVKTTPKLKHLRSSNNFPQRPTFLIISSLYVSVPHSNTTDRFFLVTTTHFPLNPIPQPLLNLQLNQYLSSLMKTPSNLQMNHTI